MIEVTVQRQCSRGCGTEFKEATGKIPRFSLQPCGLRSLAVTTLAVTDSAVRQIDVSSLGKAAAIGGPEVACPFKKQDYQ
jgi:hypothetical protein